MVHIYQVLNIHPHNRSDFKCKHGNVFHLLPPLARQLQNSAEQCLCF